MTEPPLLDECEAAVRKWAPRLGLRDWVMDIHEAGILADSEASIEIDREQRRAEIAVSTEGRTRTVEELMLHELVHIILLPSEWLINDKLDRVRRLWDDVIERQVWCFVDALLATDRGQATV